MGLLSAITTLAIIWAVIVAWVAGVAHGQRSKNEPSDAREETILDYATIALTLVAIVLAALT